MKIRLLAIIIFFLTTLLLVNIKSSTLAQSPNAMAKIAPWVLEHTTDNKDAEFLVVLVDQADLSGAAALQTKAEKGRFVYNALYRKAQTTQKPLLDWLSQNRIEHRSFYIVNMIWVKGNFNVALTLALRADVERIEGNPVVHNNIELPEAGAIKQPQVV